MRGVTLVVVLVAAMLATMAYGASMTGSTKMIGSGSASVSHPTSNCQVAASENILVAGTEVIDLVKPTISCDAGGTYQVEATVAAGGSTSVNQTTASLTANTAQTLTIDVNPNIDASSPQTYSVTYRAKGQ